MKNADKVYIKVGKIGSTFGIKGWLKIQTYTEFGASILTYSPWHLLDNNGNLSETVTIEDSRPHGGTGIIIKLPNIETPEEARLLTGKTIAIARDQLPALEKDEYYWTDLEGLSVYNTQNEFLGKIIYMISTGSNDVLVVIGDKEHAIPYMMGSVIKKIDLAKREMHVDWDPL
jgi:16S rRNA processing protein RimM